MDKEIKRGVLVGAIGFTIVTVSLCIATLISIFAK